MSVPASFRAALKAKSRTGNTAATAPSPLFLMPSRTLDCIEGWTETAFDALAAELDKLPKLGTERHVLRTALFGDSVRLEADKEGRIVLPADLIAHAELKPEGTVTIIGVGDTFEIWDVAAAARRKAEVRKQAAALNFDAPGVSR